MYFNKMLSMVRRQKVSI